MHYGTSLAFAVQCIVMALFSMLPETLPAEEGAVTYSEGLEYVVGCADCARTDGGCYVHEDQVLGMDVVWRTDADDPAVDHEDAVWKQSYISDLPDSAFLLIEAGGTHDSSGKTTPRALRHFPVRDAEGRLDLVHVRAAVDMAPKAKLPAHVIADVQDRARVLLAERGAHHHPSRMDEGEESRVDTIRLDASKMRRTPQGGVKLPGALTKVGVFRYTRKDGTVVREYRPAAEVFHKDSLASLEDAPVTDLHPAVMVDTANYKSLAKGHVRDVRQDGRHAMAEVVVQDGDLANKILNRERTDISCGYKCRLDNSPGSFEGQAYDVIQTNIRYNHVATLPYGTGRQGTDVALRFDACNNETQDNITMNFRLDGKDYDLSDATQKAAYEAALKAKDEANTAALAAEKTRADAEKTRADAEKTRADGAQAAHDMVAAELKPLKAAKIATARKALEATARPHTDVKFDGLSDREVMERALSHKELNFDGKSDDYVRACFDMLGNASATQDPAATAVFNALQTPGRTPSNSTPAGNPLGELWKQPLVSSKAK